MNDTERIAKLILVVSKKIKQHQELADMVDNERMQLRYLMERDLWKEFLELLTNDHKLVNIYQFYVGGKK